MAEAIAEHDDPNWRVRVNEERDYMPFRVDTSDIEENLDRIEEASELSKHYALVDDKRYFAADTYDLFGGNTIELVARMIGCYDKVIEGTEEDFDGPKFPPEVVDHIAELLGYIITNFTMIEELIHKGVLMVVSNRIPHMLPMITNICGLRKMSSRNTERSSADKTRKASLGETLFVIMGVV